MRFKVRHAPIPASGSPWPMPRTYLPTRTTFKVLPGDLRFRMVGGESCDILERNFKRITSNMFGNADSYEDVGTDAEVDNGPSRRGRARSILRWLNVTVLKECSEYPYLEMDESCELADLLINWLIMCAYDETGCVKYSLIECDVLMSVCV
jgi:hypothetical protein